MSEITFESAKEFLRACYRIELRDHAFGDVEISWQDAEGKEVAAGYIGSSNPSVGIFGYDNNFDGPEAHTLATFGTLKSVERNDEVGPPEFVVGQIMPGLTKEGVLADWDRERP